MPVVRILEKDVLSDKAHEAEKRWVKQLLDEGMPLLNISLTARALNPHQRIAELEIEVATLKEQIAEASARETVADAEDVVSYFSPKSKREIAIQIIERGLRLLKEAEDE